MTSKYTPYISIPRFLLIAIIFIQCSYVQEQKSPKPNFLLLMSDNQSWNHLTCYGDPVVKTPAIDQLASQGIRFTHAFCAAPSCTPARAAMLTGQDIWRLEEGANLWGILPAKFMVYTDALEEAGYHVGMEGKGWGPGNFQDGGRSRNPGGDKYESFTEFLDQKEESQPFCYWYSSRDPHRPYKVDQSKRDSLAYASVVVPPYLPDNMEVRGDMLDYYAEIERFDNDVQSFVHILESRGERDNTVMVVCSDNGWQMPRGLANLYDFGTRIPFIMVLPQNINGNRMVDDFVSLNDIAPTFLELAGLIVPDQMTASSLVKILESEESRIIEPQRSFITSARERHAYVRQGGAGYGGRMLRTRNYLYIRNYDYETWPAGDPPLFGDVDAHMLHYPSPTKINILKNRDTDESRKFFELAFNKRPYEELYNIKSDPNQLANVAEQPEYQDIKKSLSSTLDAYLVKTKDPRAIHGEMKWIGAEYYAPRDFHPVPSREARETVGLKKRYSYVD